MRVLALALALALAAGCIGDDDPQPPTSTPTPDPSPGPTGPLPTPEPTPSPTPPTAPEPLPPKVVADQAFDFSREGDPTGQSPRTRPTEAVPEGYPTLLVNITTQRTTGLPVSGSISDPSIAIVDPNGVEVHVESEEGVARALTFPAVPGVWEVVYRGAGTMSATVRITAVA